MKHYENCNEKEFFSKWVREGEQSLLCSKKHFADGAP